MKTIAVIGGTGVYSPDIFESSEPLKVNTPYGCINLIKSSYKGNVIYFLERHGANHKVPPHMVNYLGNIYALKTLGVDRVFATAAVGSMISEIEPGSFVIIDQFLEFTKDRVSTFFNGENGVVHIDMTEPYCVETRKVFIDCCRKLNIKFFDKGTYVCTEGPRFENKAEINMFKILGGHVVGMTNFPEAVLAREANLCYSTVAMVTNYAAGISLNPLTHREVMDNMNLMADNIKKLFLLAIDEIPEIRSCSCKDSTQELGNLK